jgi:hypothetical protein
MSVIFSVLQTKISIIFTPEWKIGKHIYVTTGILQTYYTIDTVKRQLQKSEKEVKYTK